MPLPQPLRRLAPPALLLAPVLVLYARALDRYFVSEDFVILRRLWAGSWWETVAAQFTSPWLGLEMFRFYRPVATLLLAVEAALFGVQPLPYLLVHLLVHGLNVLLLYRCAAHLLAGEPPALPWCAALLFGLYPLHPNAVVFVASFATLFAATFVLLALLAFLRLRETGGGRWWVLAVLAFALALGCYEGAVVLPALLLGLDLVAPAGEVGWRRRLARHLSFLAVAGFYLLGRKLLFGAVLGGYQHMGQRLRTWPVQLLEDLLDSLRRLPWPAFETVPDAGLQTLGTGMALALVLLAATVALTARLAGRERTCSSLLLVAVGWMVVSQAPFAFARVVPGNGRYWYLTAAGLALAAVAAAGLAARLLRRSPAPAVWLVTAGLLVAWVPLLARNLDRHAAAGELTRQLRQQLVALAGRDGDGPWLVAGYPRFVSTGGGAPAAQVFHWGLSDALRPPFVARQVRVYPLPQADADFLRPLLASPLAARVLLWDDAARQLRPAAVPEPALPLATIPVHRPIDGAVLAADGSDWQLAAETRPEWQLTLNLVAPSNARQQPLAAGDGRFQADLPADFLRLIATLDGGEETFWWLEARDASGALVAFSPLARWRLAAPAAAAARR